MKKAFFLFVLFAITAMCFALPVVSENIGPPSVVLTVSDSNYSPPAMSTSLGDTTAVPSVSASTYAVDEIVTTENATTVSAFSSKQYRESLKKSITLAALMSCTLLALVSYLSSARYDVFDLRDRKQPLPMDQTVALSA